MRNRANCCSYLMAIKKELFAYLYRICTACLLFVHSMWYGCGISVRQSSVLGSSNVEKSSSSFILLCSCHENDAYLLLSRLILLNIYWQSLHNDSDILEFIFGILPKCLPKNDNLQFKMLIISLAKPNSIAQWSVYFL